MKIFGASGVLAALALLLLPNVAHAATLTLAPVLGDIIVPEPASLGVLAVGGAFLFLRRRK